MKRLPLFIFIMLGFSLNAWSQTTTGTLTGKTTDDSGAPLPGVTITLESPDMIGGRSAVSNANGSYILRLLPPGQYTVTATMPGFQTQKTNTRVGLGQTVTLNFVIAPSSVSEDLVVTAETPVISTASTATSTNIDATQIERLPVSRNADDLLDFAPGVNGNLAYGGTQAAANAYNLDGVNVADPASGDRWILPNVDWIKEIQVLGLGAPAEYGGFTGGAVNIITKSGGNQFEGDFKAYYSGGDLVADDSENEEFTDIAFSAGGPLIKDRLWYFVSGEEVSDVTSPTGINDTIASFSGALVGGDRDLFANENDRTTSRYLAKLTFQAAEDHRLTGLLSYDAVEEDFRDLSRETLGSAASIVDSPNLTYNLTWEWLASASQTLSAKLSGFSGELDRLPRNGANLPGRSDFETGIAFQNATYTRTEDKERRSLRLDWNIFADGLFTSGDSHDFKIGLEISQGEQEERRIRNGGLTILDDTFGVYDTVADYLADPDGALFSSDQGNEINLEAEQDELILFVQDTWTIDRLTVNYGVRYTSFEAGFSNVGDVYDQDLIAPRVGFAYDLTGEGDSVIKAHFGRYYEGMFSFLYDRERSGEAFSALEFVDYNPDTGQFDIPAGGRAAQAADLDPDIDHPHVDQFLITYERELFPGVRLGLDYVNRETRDIIAMVNSNADYDELIAPGNPFGGDLPFFDLLSSPEFVLTNPDGAFRDYESVTLRVNRSYSDGWSLDTSVVFADLEGNTFKANGYVPEWEDANGQTNAAGELPGYAELEVKVRASVDLPWGILASANYTHLAGEHWTPFVRFRGLLDNDRETAFLTERGSQQLPDRNILDLKLSKRFRFNERFALDVFADVFNVFDQDTILFVEERWGDYFYDFGDHPNSSEFVENGSFGEVDERELGREIRLGFKALF